MRAFTTAFVAVSALLGAIASPHDRRGHNELAKRMEGTLEKRRTFTNARFTWYPTDTGADACTGKNHQDDSWVVALNMPLFGNSGNGHCGKQIKISYNGKSTVATIADACATCYSDSDIDLTKGLFEFFDGNLGDGVFYGTWEFVDGDDSPPPPPPKPSPKPQPKPSPKPEPKPSPKPSPETPKIQKASVSSSHKPSSSAKPKPSVKPSSVHVSPAPASATPAPYTPPAAAADTPAVPVNAGSSPSDTPEVQGGIGNNGPLSGGAISVSINHAAFALTALAVLAVQAL